MEARELRALISGGESSKVQLKERLPHGDSLAHEIIAFSNSQGGVIVFGVQDKTGNITGLSFAEIREINSQIVNAASQKVFPPVFVTTETVAGSDKNCVLVWVEEGIGKPYKDSNGTIFVKNGADKRKVTSNDELARLLRGGGSLYAEETLINGSSFNDIDVYQFDIFLLRKYKKSLADLQADNPHISAAQIFDNLNLKQGDTLTLAGLLLFSSKRHLFRPQFSVQCVSMDGSLVGSTFADNEGAFEGTLREVFQKTLDFIGRGMKKVPESEGFNSPTKWEIPYEVFEELIANALVHRDYFTASTVKVLIYADRVEIISPGKLPNSLTIENIKNGVSVSRNPILLSHAQFLLPYKGLGTGIPRSYSLYPDITIESSDSPYQFKVTIKRKQG
jgi:predicted HTH transcriptional regulator